MSSRIQKQIGYFLSDMDICVDNPVDFIDELDPSILLTLAQAMQKSSNAYTRYLAKSYEQMLIEKKLKIEDLIVCVYFGDTFMGFLLRSYDQSKYARRDDLIDYYECDLENKIKYLNQSIYPTTGYIYQGGLEGLTPGEVIDGIEAGYWVTKQTQTELHSNINIASKQIVDSGLFKPNIEELMFLLAKSCGLIKENIDKLKFDSSVRPVILQYWS